MSFLSGFMGNKAAGSFVDQAVDQAAAVAKRKVKEAITGKKQVDNAGGMGDLFPSEGQKKPKQKEGGLFGGLLNTEPGAQQPAPPAAHSSGDDGGFADALDDLASEFATQK
ncbi:uncharacterized protein zgc:193505 [Triplophysa rosa]|uniref:Uncharacterized protein n=1 Tax=Triplophysa rosa TaxID=992332 RepID=A0A9W7WNS9_TRIRA|nr:uncharacterized protein zgc:193505 [Triplophysa rosa]KAI7805584.1 hypothetical protein IRJ41_011578 [Triplophysa rosa]